MPSAAMPSPTAYRPPDHDTAAMSLTAASDTHGDLQRIVVRPTATLIDALRAIDRGAYAIAFVCDDTGRVLGTVTDGDVRRALIAGSDLGECCLERIMRREFVWVGPEATRAEVLDLLRARVINQVPVLDGAGRLIGLHTVREMLGPAVRPNSALILAGGKGTRLRPITENIPKPMIRVAGRPILERLVLHLMGSGVRTIYLSVNYLAHMVEEHFGDGERFGCRIEYVREDRPLGTGGPLAEIPTPERALLVMNGDLVTQADLGRLLDFHEAGGYAATFGVRPFQVQIPFGVAEVEGERLVALREKPTHSMLVNAGIYAISPEAIRLVPRGVEYPITDLFNRCIADGLPVGVHAIEDEWADIGRHDELRKARGEA
jgi:dTDP-glucose pyrophosphorylase/CBS domain-containing protein